LSNVIAISTAYDHNLALRSDGTVVAWANNDILTNVPPNLSGVVAISAAQDNDLALKSDGTVVSWGIGQTNAPAGLSNAVAIVAGFPNLALRADGTVLEWGETYGLQTMPVGLTDVVAISRSDHSLALRADGTVVEWGSVNYHPPLNVPSGLSSVLGLVAGESADLALKTDGTVIAWGYNNATNLPDGLRNVLAVASGERDGLALIGDRAPLVRAPLTNAKRDATGFSCSLPSQSGKVYALEYKDSIGQTDWTALPLIPGNGGVVTLTDSLAPPHERFYRVRRW
jgi:hypothetical protein